MSASERYWTKPGPGRPRLPDDVGRHEQAPVRITRWMRDRLMWIQFQEEGRTGVRPSLARVVRGCIWYGINRYKELGQLPSLDR